MANLTQNGPSSYVHGTVTTHGIAYPNTQTSGNMTAVTTNAETLAALPEAVKTPRARDYDKLSVAPFKAFLAAESQFSQWVASPETTPALTYPNDPVIHFLLLMLKEAENLTEMHNEIYSVDANGNSNLGKSFFVFDMAYSTVQARLAKVRESLVVYKSKQ